MAKQRKLKSGEQVIASHLWIAGRHVGSYPDYPGKEIKVFLTINDHVLLRWPSG